MDNFNEHFNEKEMKLIQEHIKEIKHYLDKLTKNLDISVSDYQKDKILNGRLTDIFDEYRRLHAVVLNYREITNRELIEMITAG